MKKTEKNIIEALSKVPFSPSESWRLETERQLGILAESAPSNIDHPRTDRSPYKFYISNFMNFSSKTVMTVVLAIAGVLVIGGGTALAADGAKPGDALFGVDKAFENFQRAITSDPARKAGLEMDIMEERMAELDLVDQEGNELHFRNAADEVTEQQNRVRETVREMYQLNVNEEAEMNKVWSRFSEQVESHSEELEGLQAKHQVQQGQADEEDEDDGEDGEDGDGGTSLDLALEEYETSDLYRNHGEDNATDRGVQIQKQDQTSRPDDAGTGNGN